MKILFEKAYEPTDQPLTDTDKEWILPDEETSGFAFCHMQFAGLVK